MKPVTRQLLVEVLCFSEQKIHLLTAAQIFQPVPDKMRSCA